jgi:hypothetical protein
MAREVRREIPDMRILMLTAVNTKFPLGFGPKDIDDEWLPVTDFVEKPVDLDVLCTRVAELLKDSAGRAADADASGPGR